MPRVLVGTKMVFSPRTLFRIAMFTLGAAVSATSCGGGGGAGNEAIRHGVGAACSSNVDCTEAGQTCLPFKGGYCGVQDCVDDAHCPQGAACVKYTDGKQYCFLLCIEKPDCNFSRPPELEANCSSSIEFVSGAKTSKVCLPPTG
jgi:hypothetical protein